MIFFCRLSIFASILTQLINSLIVFTAQSEVWALSLRFLERQIVLMKESISRWCSKYHMRWWWQWIWWRWLTCRPWWGRCPWRRSWCPGWWSLQGCCLSCGILRIKICTKTYENLRQHERILSSFFCPSLQSSSESTPKLESKVPGELKPVFCKSQSKPQLDAVHE